MKIEELIIKDSNGKTKRAKAVFKIEGQNKYLTRRFGSPSGYTYFDGASNKVKSNYISRHKALKENWSDITTAGALSRFVLWEHRSISEIERTLKNKYKIKRVVVDLSKNAKS